MKTQNANASYVVLRDIALCRRKAPSPDTQAQQKPIPLTAQKAKTQDTNGRCPQGRSPKQRPERHAVSSVLFLILRLRAQGTRSVSLISRLSTQGTRSVSTSVFKPMSTSIHTCFRLGGCQYYQSQCHNCSCMYHLAVAKLILNLPVMS